MADYHLESRAGGFSDQDRERMAAFLRALPTIEIGPVFVVFGSESDREDRRAFVEALEERVRDVLTSVVLGETDVAITLSGNPRAAAQVRRFVDWCLAELPCELERFGRKVDPEELAPR